MAAVVTNDSDLVEPIRVVRDELGKAVVVLAPDRHRTSRALSAVANRYKPIREGVLRASQFPDVLTDASGTITKPDGW